MNTRAMETQNVQTDALTRTTPVYCRVPAADIYETGDAYVLMLDLPGARKESISLTLEKGELRVKAENDRTDPAEGMLFFSDVPPGAYTRVFSLGEGINLANVDARFENGVLTVKLYKNEERKPREITIH